MKKSQKILFQEIREKWQKIGIPEQIFHDFLKLHQRSFSSVPKGYILPKQVIKSLFSISVPLEPMEKIAKTANWASTALIGQIIGNKYKYPWYWLDKNLAQDLNLTTPPESIPKKINLPPLGLILLPKNLIKTSTGNINFILYSLLKPGEKTDFELFTVNKYIYNPVYSRFSDVIPQDRYKLFWFASELHTYIYGGNLDLVFNGEEFRISQGDFDSLIDEKNELNESNKILALLLNCLMYSEPQNTDILETGEEAKTKGFGKNSNKKNYSCPLWIGKGYKSVYSQSSEPKETHASPTPHWRRGHWQRIAFGKGKKERRWDWRPPTLVGLNKN